jgi:hypothetical protein
MQPSCGRCMKRLDRRFNQPHAEWMGVFRAAADVAVMVEVSGDELPPEDRQLLRNHWVTLVQA